MKKDIEWLKREIHKELEDWHGVEGGIDGDGINEIMLLINQHEESEVKRLERKMKELESCNDELIRDNNQLRNELDNQEVLSWEWISENRERKGIHFYVNVTKLQNLLVPKQEEVDQAYKDGYEKGKQRTFYKGYLEGITDKGSEPETVADVVTTFWKSYERLKEVMSMEVEELEE